jgi:tetratricopeptide (TPR) repeat protein/TolB-like protein/predicted Ser/Thr protein kinase
MIGKTISHYRILEKLGEGGMGVVYRAEDTSLNRTVALKFLPPEMTSDPEAKARFVHEAQAAAALDHPNICTIYEIGEADDRSFIAMAVVDGQSLREKIAGGPLGLDAAMNLAIQIAEGLAAAHANGIVHRDIKPGNVMITSDNRARVMDFGLAWSPGQTRITRPGMTTGTIAYMSPEQSQGEGVDHRTDIWSFGVMLYEMITGRRPFRGDHDQAVVYSIVNEEPEPVTALRTGVPMELERITVKAMAKPKEERYQTVLDMLVDLRAVRSRLGAETGARTSASRPADKAGFGTRRRRWWAAAAVVLVAAMLVWLVWTRTRPQGLNVDPDRVVVATFENMTGDESLDPVGPMVADWIAQGLSQTGEVDVVSAMTALQSLRAVGAEAGGLHDASQLRELATETGAGTVVTGSYYLEGEHLRFHAKVLNAEDGSVVYAPPSVCGPSDAPMQTIEEVRQRVMGALVTDFNPSMSSQPPIFEAYREYTVGLTLFGEDYSEAIRHFKRAAAIDSTFMFPRVYIATAYSNQGEWARADSVIRVLGRNRERLAPGGRHIVDWLVASSRGDSEEALRSLRRAEVLDPRNTTIRYLIGLEAFRLNRPQEAVDAFVTLRSSEPESESVRWTWGVGYAADAHHMLGDYEPELEQLRRGIAYFPDVMSLRAREVRALSALGRVREVDDVIDQVLATPSRRGSPIRVMDSAAVWLRAHGHTEDALRIADRAVDWLGSRSEEAIDERHRRYLVGVLCLIEQWDEAAVVAGELARANPDEIEWQGWLGCLAARTGNRDEALRIREELERLERPYMFGGNFYWSACITAILGEREGAVERLREAFARGYPYTPYLRADPNLETMRGYPPFQELIRPKG